jgi:hypothetical protein
MNTWRDACELQQQKLNSILKDFSSKSMPKIPLKTDFVEKIIE